MGGLCILLLLYVFDFDFADLSLFIQCSLLLRFKRGNSDFLPGKFLCDFGKGNGSSNPWAPSQETAEEFLGEVFCLQKNLVNKYL